VQYGIAPGPDYALLVEDDDGPCRVLAETAAPEPGSGRLAPERREEKAAPIPVAPSQE